jgi:hypothetical protein
MAKSTPGRLVALGALASALQPPSWGGFDESGPSALNSAMSNVALVSCPCN